MFLPLVFLVAHVVPAAVAVPAPPAVPCDPYAASSTLILPWHPESVSEESRFNGSVFDTVVFDATEQTDAVWQMKDKSHYLACNFTGAVEVANSSNNFTIMFTQPGTFYYASKGPTSPTSAESASLPKNSTDPSDSLRLKPGCLGGEKTILVVTDPFPCPSPPPVTNLPPSSEVPSPPPKGVSRAMTLGLELVLVPLLWVLL